MYSLLYPRLSTVTFYLQRRLRKAPLQRVPLGHTIALNCSNRFTFSIIEEGTIIGLIQRNVLRICVSFCSEAGQLILPVGKLKHEVFVHLGIR